MMRSQPVMVRLTVAQASRCEKLTTYLWPEEKLSVEEISRRLLLEAPVVGRIRAQPDRVRADLPAGTATQNQACFDWLRRCRVVNARQYQCDRASSEGSPTRAYEKAQVGAASAKRVLRATGC